jgi:hypothetical protein
MPEPVCFLATPKHASRFAVARMAGLPLPEIRQAITNAVLKIGEHQDAQPDDAKAMDALAKYVGSFLGNQRRLTSRVGPRSPSDVDPVAIERLLRVWGEAYERVKRVAYTAIDEDRDFAAEVLELARRAAAQEATRTARVEPELADRIVQHWFRSYFVDEGPAGYLVKSRHPLRYLKRQVGTYGLPPTAKPAKCATTTTAAPEEKPPREERAAMARKAFREFTTSFGAPGSGFGPLAEPKRDFKPEGG